MYDLTCSRVQVFSKDQASQLPGPRQLQPILVQCLVIRINCASGVTGSLHYQPSPDQSSVTNERVVCVHPKEMGMLMDNLQWMWCSQRRPNHGPPYFWTPS